MEGDHAWLSDWGLVVLAACGWSGDGFEGDSVAEVLEFADVVAHLAVEVNVGFVLVGAEVVERGVLAEEVPDDHQDGSVDGDDGPLLSAPSGDASVWVALSPSVRGLTHNSAARKPARTWGIQLLKNDALGPAPRVPLRLRSGIPRCLVGDQSACRCGG